MDISDILKIKWKLGEEWFEKWSYTELEFRSFHSNQNPLLALFHKGGLNSLALNNAWYYNDWTLWGHDKDKAAADETVLQKLVGQEEGYIKDIKEVIAQINKTRDINLYLIKRVRYVFLLMHYIFTTDLASHLSSAIEKRMKKLALTDREVEKVKDYLLIQETFLFKKKDEDLKNMSTLFKNIYGITIPKNYSQFDLKIKKLLIEYQKKYCWTQYGGIGTQPYTLKDVLNELEYLLRKPKPSEKLKVRQKNTTLTKLPKKDIYYFDLVKKYIYLDNLAADLYQHLFFLIATRIKRMLKISYKDLTLYSFQEIEQLVKENKVIPKIQLYKRKKYRVMAQINGKINFLYGKELFETVKAIIPKPYYDKIKTITGNIACKGVVRGEVMVIKGIRDAEKMKEGSILVAPNTNPELTMIMRKAAAIITDWGGVTSHAAIISREFGIPCIVGTDIATQVLKDGDLVEVNANKGVVNILE